MYYVSLRNKLSTLLSLFLSLSLSDSCFCSSLPLLFLFFRSLNFTPSLFVTANTPNSAKQNEQLESTRVLACSVRGKKERKRKINATDHYTGHEFASFRPLSLSLFFRVSCAQVSFDFTCFTCLFTFATFTVCSVYTFNPTFTHDGW